LSYGIHRYVIIIAITYVLKNGQSQYNYKTFFHSHLAKLINSLIVLSLKYQNSLGGLDALLTISGAAKGGGGFIQSSATTERSHP
jgi:hypothetical protein